MPRRDPPAQLSLGLQRPLGHDRDAFVETPANTEAVRTLDAWPPSATVDAALPPVLALIGPRGVGKTHLARAWAARVEATVCEEALSDEAAAGGAPVLVDRADAGALGEGVFHLMNRRGAAARPLLLVGREPPAAWAEALPDLRSRLAGLPLVELAEPDDAALAAILHRRFDARGIRASDELVAFLVRRVGRSYAEAEAVVGALDVRAAAEGRPVSRALARALLLEIEGEA